MLAASVASGDTWGVRGPTFLSIYVVLLGAASAIYLGGRRWALRPRSSRPPELHPVELAYLTGGAENALLVAFLGLYERGVIGLPVDREDREDREPTRLTFAELAELTLDRQPQVVGPISGHPVERALATALADGAERERALATVRAGVRMAEVRGTLDRLGLVAGPATQRRVRWWAAGLVLVLILGIVRLGAGVANGKPVGYLVLLLILTVAVIVRAARVPWLTPEGARLRDEVADRFAAHPETAAKVDRLREEGVYEPERADGELPVDSRTVAALGPLTAWATVPTLVAAFGFTPTMLAGTVAPGAGSAGGAGIGAFGAMSCGGGGGATGDERGRGWSGCVRSGNVRRGGMSCTARVIGGPG